jgi:dienelactone hydrolase
MNRTTTYGFACVFCALAAATAAGAEDKHPELTVKATALVDALAKEDYAAAGKDFDEVMRKAMPADKCKETWQAVVKQVGAFQKRTGTRAEKTGKYDVVFVTCKFEKLALDVKVVFNADKQVTGLFFQAAKSAYAFKPPPYARPDSFRESEVVVGSGEWALPGTLTLPKGEGPFAAAVLVHGSGPQDRDETIGPNKPFRDLAWGLASQGIAVLRYEKRTHTHGHRMAKDKEAITLDAEVVEDALAAVAELRKHKEIDGRRVFVIGHSLGALMAPRVGSRNPSLAGLVLLAGNARPLEDLILEQIIYIYSLKGDLSDRDKEALDKLKKQVARVKDAKLTADASAAELPLGIPSSYWLELRSYDQSATAARLKQPLFIAQGERDYQVTMADFEAWKKALASRRNVTFRSYPKLNHLFMEGENKAKPAEYEKAGHVSRELVDDLAAWIKRPNN